MKTLQKFASVHANVHNHFNLERHLVDREPTRNVDLIYAGTPAGVGPVVT